MIKVSFGFRVENCGLERGRRTIIVEVTTIAQVRVNGAGACLGKCGCILAACFYFYFFAIPCSMWDLSSAIRDLACSSCAGSTEC